jgi:hypothetical protein
MVRKKNKRHIQSTPSANRTQSRSLTVTNTELQKLVHQGLIVKVHKVLSCDQKSMSWVDNLINLSIKLKNQCDDLREKAYHFLMRELFSMKAFRDAFSQDGLFSKTEYYKNKIDNRITDFIIQMGKGKKGWLSRGLVATLHQVITTERVVDLLNNAENKGPELRGQIIIF